MAVTVVVVATLPTIGVVHGVHTSLGVGALVPHQLVPGYDYDITGVHTGGLGPRALFIMFRPGTDANTELAHLRRTFAPLASFAGLALAAVLIANAARHRAIPHHPPYRRVIAPAGRLMVTSPRRLLGHHPGLWSENPVTEQRRSS